MADNNKPGSPGEGKKPSFVVRQFLLRQARRKTNARRARLPVSGKPDDPKTPPSSSFAFIDAAEETVTARESMAAGLAKDASPKAASAGIGKSPGFPFPMWDDELKAARGQARNNGDIEVAKIIGELSQKGPQLQQKDRYAGVVIRLAPLEHWASPLKAVLNAGGDPNALHCEPLQEAFDARAKYNVRILLIAGADPFAISDQELDKAVKAGHKDMVGMIEAAQAGRPITRYGRYAPAPRPS